MNMMRDRNAEWRKIMDEVDRRELELVERVYDAANEQRRQVTARLKQKYIKRMKRSGDD